MLKPIFRVWNKGVTLVEMLVVLSIISFVLVGSLVLFGVVGEKQKVTTMTSNLAIISSAITSFYASSPNYDGLSETVLINSGGLPKNIIEGAALKSTYGAITVKGTTSVGVDADAALATHYRITYAGIPNSACTAFAAAAYPFYIGVYVNTSSTGADSATKLANIGAAASTDNCAKTGGAKAVHFVNK